MDERQRVKGTPVSAAPALVWVPASVGCHWSATAPDGDFHISTYCRGGVYTFPASGYRLVRNFDVLGEYETLDEAKAAAERAMSWLAVQS